MALNEKDTATYANVGFKHGLQQDLRNVMTDKKVVPGTFYLTSDTNRLYIGKTAELIAPINEGVIKVEKLSDLPKDADSKEVGIIGSFYYVENDNILCVYNGSKWVQINPDTDSVISSIAHTYGEYTDGGVAVTTTIADNNNHSIYTGITFAEGEANNKKTVEIGILKNDKEENIGITIDGDVYQLASPATVEGATAATINLTSAFGQSSSVSVSAGKGITVESANNVLTLSGFAVEEGTLSASEHKKINEVTKEETIDGFDIVLKDASGTTSTATIQPAITYGGVADNKTTAKFEGNGTADLSVYTVDEVDAKLKNLVNTYNAMLYKGTVGTNAGATAEKLPTEKVSIGHTYMANSDVELKYTITQDNKDVTKTEGPYPAGTLFIATAALKTTGASPEYYSEYTENDEVNSDLIGTLPAKGIEWTVVTGDRTDTTYKFTKLNSDLGFQLTEVNSNSGKGEFKIVNGDNVTDQKAGLIISHSALAEGETEDASKISLNIQHKAVTWTIPTPTTEEICNTNLSAEDKEDSKKAKSITYVSGLTQDNSGHIIGYNTKSALVLDTDTHYLPTNLALGMAFATDKNSVSINPSLTVTNNESKTTYTVGSDENSGTVSGITIESDTLEIASVAGGMSLNLVWGSF